MHFNVPFDLNVDKGKVLCPCYFHKTTRTVCQFIKYHTSMKKYIHDYYKNKSDSLLSLCLSFKS